jgi:release factor glutamine methyltransferase
VAITYHDLFLNTNKALEAQGIEGAKLEAQEILCIAAGKTREELLRDYSLYTTDEIAQKTEELLQRRLTGEPVAYLAGEWDFHRLTFYVNKEALIPRMDTEVLTQLAIKHLVKDKQYVGAHQTRVLDLCAGTGCVGISVAASVKNVRAVLVDLSDGALELCKRNIRRHNLTGRVVHLKGDVMQAPSHALGQFDLVLCNPPYIPTGDIPTLDPSVKNFEPIMALDGGQDGLDFYRAVISLWTPVVKPGGHLLFEVGIGEAEKVAQMLVDARYQNVLITRDTAKIMRVVEGRRPEPSLIDTFHEHKEEAPDGRKKETH